jgi:hypothetical protein
MILRSRRAAFLVALLLIGAARGRADAARQDEHVRPPVRVVVPVEGVVQRIELLDGSTMYGRVVSVDGDQVVFEPVLGGRITLRRETIASLAPARGRIRNGVFVPSLAPATRLFFAPTARPLAAREQTFGVYDIFLPFLQVGVTDRFSIGGGTPLFFEGGDGTHPVWVTPKLTVYSRHDRSVAAGIVHVFGLDHGTGIAYGVTTIGPPEGAVTAGLGYAYAGRSHALVVMVGGEKQISRRLQFITENWIWKGGYGIASAGIRINGERLTADVGLGFPLGVDDAFGFPMVNFSYRF